MLIFLSTKIQYYIACSRSFQLMCSLGTIGREHLHPRASEKMKYNRLIEEQIVACMVQVPRETM
jgi:hypothetical protein